MGLSGRLAAAFLGSELTPLLALTALLAGLFAVLVTPREEEPQIDVTFANVFVPFPGASAAEVERLVATPAEQVLSEVEGIEHIYSMSRPGMAVLSIQFRVGEDYTDSVVRLYNQVFSNSDWFPSSLGVGQPIVKPKGIDDVPIVTVTLWSRDPALGAAGLARVSHSLEAELKRIPGTRNIYTIGAPDEVVHVLLDPRRMASYGLALDDLRRSLSAANVSVEAGALVAGNRAIPVRAGTFLVDADEVAELVVGSADGRPVFLADVAEIRQGVDWPQHLVRHGTVQTGMTDSYPAVTLAVAKQPGTNAVDIANRVIERLERLRGIVVPDDVEMTVTRNYGETAYAKAAKLMQKLLFATLSVVLLVLVTMGWREALVVGTAVTVTLAATLFASWAVGFTLNRVSLFALIFSIGILVDDAIVVVENIHRHMQHGGGRLAELIPAAVDEVGQPTILATFTVIAALLPMAFVSGLMGPYMSPIPINASIGMLISLLVALVVTPWLCHRLLASPRGAGHGGGEFLKRLFRLLIGPFLGGRRGRLPRLALAGSVLVLIGASIWLVPSRNVVLKMLPFDDKSEVQVVVDLAEGAALEWTARVLDAVAESVAGVAEIANYQMYAGSAAPIGFNGLVRQYYLRSEPHQGDVQINLVDKSRRDRSSHEVARDIRRRVEPVGERFAADIKVVEVPPGPPVLAPLVAEVYGLDEARRAAAARRLRELFESTADIVDVGDTIEHPGPRLVVDVDRPRAARLGVSQRDVVAALDALLAGEDVSYLRDTHLKYAMPVRIELPTAEQGDIDNALAVRVRGRDGAMVPLSEVVEVRSDVREAAIHHKDLLPVTYVTGDMAGELDSPLYGMLSISRRIAGELRTADGEPLPQHFVAAPQTPYHSSIKWDGEWQVTYETFRDMGIAYAVGMILIYLLVVGQFRSYLVPLVIMAPIPLTVIGVLPGHALIGAQFTATSMIGMIALAGIIVRNSILLVDFVNEQRRTGVGLEDAVIGAGAVRARPIVLTGLAAMLGALFILDDPIFNGLAVSLISGILVSTLLTLLVIPVLYYSYRRDRDRDVQHGPMSDDVSPP